MESRHSIVFTDMEGTLFTKSPIVVDGHIAPSAWAMIPQILGPSAVETSREGERRWNAGEFNGYVEWVDYAARNYQKHGLTKKQFDDIIASIEYHPGVHTTFAQLRKKYRTALVSGGIKAQADRAQRDLRLDHAFAACDFFWNDDGTIDHWNSLPCDYEGKVDFMKLIIKEHKADPQECVFIGDGINDVPLAQAVGISIAFNADHRLQDVSTHVINQPKGQEDFSEVLKYIPL